MTDLLPDDDPLIEQLRALPGASPTPDLTSGLLGRVSRNRQERRHLRQVVILGVGACLVLALRLVQTTPTPVSDRVLAANAGIRWLLDNQQADGSWSAADHGGHARFTPGVSALATLALLYAPDGFPSEATGKAVAYLERNLHTVSLSAEAPGMYNELLSLRAVLEMESRSPSTPRRDRIRSVLNELVRLQLPDGGWGYVEDTPLGYGTLNRTRSNSAVTWWVCDLLREAGRLGIRENTSALERGEQWLATCFLPHEPPRYRQEGREAQSDDALFWMAKAWQGSSVPPDNLAKQAPRDYYRELLKREAQPSDPGTHTKALLTLQEPDGAWRGPDRWWSAGGQVYATSAAILALAPRG